MASRPLREETALRDVVQRLCLANRHYGYRRIGALLRREGWCVNHKRLLRIMHEDNLLCLRRPRFRLPETGFAHRWQVWPNLAPRMVPMAVNQLWVADITYVRLSKRSCMLQSSSTPTAAKWWAGRRMITSERSSLSALEMALSGRDVIAGSLVQHSDRGIQCAFADYITRLEAARIQPSMSRGRCPYDNAMAKSFMKALKQEEVNASDYRDLDHARSSIGAFIEETYNRQRLHSALGYRSPVEYEKTGSGAAAQQPLKARA
jgi:putative transposase